MSAAQSYKYKYPELDAVIPGCVHFRWREALFLPKWEVMVYPTEMQYQNIIKLARVMDAIRNRFGKPVRIESWLRPQNYNQWGDPYGVGGAHLSSHIEGFAADFNIITVPSSVVREGLRPELERLKIRMENNEEQEKKKNKFWVHVDLRVPGGSGRYFVP